MYEVYSHDLLAVSKQIQKRARNSSQTLNPCEARGKIHSIVDRSLCGDCTHLIKSVSANTDSVPSACAQNDGSVHLGTAYREGATVNDLLLVSLEPKLRVRDQQIVWHANLDMWSPPGPRRLSPICLNIP